MNKKNAYLCLLLTPILVMVLVSAFACKKSSQATFPTMFSTPTPDATASPSSLAFISQWKGSSSVTLFNPHSVVVDSVGRVYVSSWGNNSIQVFTTAGASVTYWTVGYHPEGIGVQPDTGVFVSDAIGNLVYEYTKDGTSVDSKYILSESDICDIVYTPGPTATSTPVTLNANFSESGNQGTALDTSSTLFNTTFWNRTGDCGNNSRAVVWRLNNGAHTFISLWASAWGANSYFSALALDSTASYLYVTDSSANTFFKLITSTSAVPVFTTDTDLNAPRGIAVDSLGYVYVADTGNHRIKVYDSTLSLKTTLGHATKGSDPGWFNNPYGVAVDSDRNLYVADTDNNRIQKFSPYIP